MMEDLMETVDNLNGTCIPKTPHVTQPNPAASTGRKANDNAIPKECGNNKFPLMYNPENKYSLLPILVSHKTPGSGSGGGGLDMRDSSLSKKNQYEKLNDDLHKDGLHALEEDPSSIACGHSSSMDDSLCAEASEFQQSTSSLSQSSRVSTEGASSFSKHIQPSSPGLRSDIVQPSTFCDSYIQKCLSTTNNKYIFFK